MKVTEPPEDTPGRGVTRYGGERAKRGSGGHDGRKRRDDDRKIDVELIATCETRLPQR